MQSSTLSHESLGRNLAVLYSTVAVAVAIVVVAAWLALGYLREETELRTSVASANLARSLELNIEGVINLIDGALDATATEIGRQIATGHVDQKSITGFMRRQQDRVVHLNLLRATDVSGDAIYGVGVPTPPATIADRDYFIGLRDDADAGLVIVQPVLGRISQRWIWLLARRINRSDGSFGGVVYAGIFVEELENLLAQFKIAAGDSIALRDASLGLIARFPPVNRADVPIGDKRLSSAFLQAFEGRPQEGGYVSGGDSTDGIDRSHVFRRNARHGFLINVGVDRQAAVQEWNHQSSVVIEVAAAFLLALAAFTLLMSRAWHRQDENLQALEENRQSLTEAQSIANLGEFSFDLHTQRWSSSNILDGIFGIDAAYPRDVQHWLALVAEEMREPMHTFMTSLEQQRLGFDREFRIIRASDGKPRWLHGKGRLRVDANHRPIGLRGTIQDITSYKEVEISLRESEDRYRKAFMTSPDAVNITRLEDGRYLDVSDGFTRMMGWSREEVIGKTSLELKLWHDPDDRKRIMEVLKRDGFYQNLEANFQAKDGRVMSGLMSAHLMTIKGEQCLLSVTRDITDRKRAEVAQRESEARFRTLIEWTPEAIAVHRAGKVIYVNPATIQMLGATSAEQLLGKAMLEFVHRDFREAVLQRVKVQVEDGVRVPLTQEKFVRLDGTPIDVEVQAAPIVYDGEPAIQVAMRDITEHNQAQDKLKLAASVFSHAREGITITDAQATIIDINETFTDITGYTREEIIGKNPRILQSGRQSKAFYVALWRDLLEKGQWSGEVWNRRKNGEIYPELLTISAVRDGQGATRNYVALFSDISAQKEHERQLEHNAHFDALTGLPNRVLLADRLQQSMTQALRRGGRVAVAYLDLDGFKAINDHHGHQVGDHLLVGIGACMKQVLRDGDTLARLGGDEFVAVLIDLEDAPDSVPMLTRLLHAAAQPVVVGGLSLQVSASLGVTFYPQAQDIDADQLLRQADQAMYQAKVAGKNRFQIFDATRDTSMRLHNESLVHIQRALERGELVLYYQPKVNLRSGQIIGAEALIRWQHPERGLLAPAAFLPVIEDHPLAIAVGEWVIDTALGQIAHWRAAGLDIAVSVNVGARQLQQDAFLERLRAILAAHPEVNPSSLELEILETSALEDVAQVSQVISACAEIGVTFALDDFGTGYSSLTYLKRLRVGMLKIDQSFVHDMLDDPDDLAILKGVIGLAEAFHHQVIAEGVETIEHGASLLRLGCENAQGYGIAHPMPANEFLKWAGAWRPDQLWSSWKPPA